MLLYFCEILLEVWYHLCTKNIKSLNFFKQISDIKPFSAESVRSPLLVILWGMVPFPVISSKRHSVWSCCFADSLRVPSNSLWSESHLLVFLLSGQCGVCRLTARDALAAALPLVATPTLKLASKNKYGIILSKALSPPVVLHQAPEHPQTYLLFPI